MAKEMGEVNAGRPFGSYLALYVHSTCSIGNIRRTRIEGGCEDIPRVGMLDTERRAHLLVSGGENSRFLRFEPLFALLAHKPRPQFKFAGVYLPLAS